MSQAEVMLVRVYCSEKDHQHRRVIDALHRDHRVAGVTAFRGIAGFGKSGQLHEASLLDVSLDLPIIVEFFDTPDRIEAVLPVVEAMVGRGHIVAWPARANLE